MFAPEPKRFFDAGLRFECTGCGRCCTGAPGVVQVTEAEADAMASHLDLDADTFRQRFTRRAEGRLALREHADGRCVFYDEGCDVYPVRPAQCRAFPFWLKNLRNLEAWRRAAAECPGIGRGPLHSREAILREVAASPV
jgi:uncharacterized protein